MKKGCPCIFSDSDKVVEMVINGKRMELDRSQPYTGLPYSHGLLMVRNYLPINTWAIRRECFTQVGRFDETLPIWEDWELLLKFSRTLPFHKTAVTTTEFRKRNDLGDHVSARDVDIGVICEQLFSRYPATGDELINDGRCIFQQIQLEANTAAGQ